MKREFLISLNTYPNHISRGSLGSLTQTRMISKWFYLASKSICHFLRKRGCVLHFHLLWSIFSTSRIQKIKTIHPLTKVNVRWVWPKMALKLDFVHKFNVSLLILLHGNIPTSTRSIISNILLILVFYPISMLIGPYIIFTHLWCFCSLSPSKFRDPKLFQTGLGKPLTCCYSNSSPMNIDSVNQSFLMSMP